MKEQLRRVGIRRALVTGGSSGIGLSFAKQLASCGVELLLVSNRNEELKEAANMLTRDYSVSVDTLCLDLAQTSSAMQLFEQHFSPDLVVNNAGIFFFNDLLQTPAHKAEAMVLLHVYTLTSVCRLFAQQMAEKGGGYIVNLSSMAAWMPFPGIALYSATKAYVRTLSLSLHEEFKERNVGVTVACPGAVDTDLFGLSLPLRKLGVSLRVIIPPDTLAQQVLKGTIKGKRSIVPGFINRLFILIVGTIPQWMLIYIRRKMKRFMQ